MSKKLNSILLVDDDLSVNYLHAYIIDKEDLAHSLEISETGEQALEFLRRPSNPDLILLDLNMPKMDGWKFIEEYKKLPHPGKKKTVLIILSSSANPDDKKRAAAMKEVAGFYNKPLTTEVMREIAGKYF